MLRGAGAEEGRDGDDAAYESDAKPKQNNPKPDPKMNKVSWKQPPGQSHSGSDSESS